MNIIEATQFIGVFARVFYGLLVGLLVLFMIFAVNMVLQYKGVGRWKDYLYGERTYIILSFVAKTLLAWLVFAGLFMPH